MKQLLAIFLLFFTLHLQAQETPAKPLHVQPALIEFNGGMYNGNTVEIDAPAGLIEDVLKDNFKLQGVKAREIKGFLVFRNVIVKNIDADKPIDAFIKVERKGRKENEISKVSFITSPAGQISDDKLKSGVATATVTAAAVSGLLFTDITPDIDNKVFEKNVMEQTELVKKSEKKLKELQEDQQKMEQKIKNLQDDLENNRKDQEAQVAELEKKREALNLLISKKPAGAILPGNN